MKIATWLLLAIAGMSLPALAAAPAPAEARAGQELAGKRIYIVHGYRATPDDHWFGWLQRNLAARGAQVTVLRLPDSAHPDPARWQHAMAAGIGRPGPETYFVAHSLGAITLLRYLDTLPAGTRVGGFVLVSGFATALPGLPELDRFTADGIDAPRIMRMAPRRAVIVAGDDGIVPPDATRALARRLQAPPREVPHGGHFLAEDGFTEFPQVAELLDGIVSAR